MWISVTVGACIRLGRVRREAADRPGRYRKWCGIAGILVTLGLHGCGDSEVALGFCELEDPDVRTILAEGPERWDSPPALVEIWRAGGLRETEVIGFPAGLAVSGEGRTALPDFNLGEVSLVEADGTWAGTLLPHGPGPGEVQIPIASAWGADGGLTVWDLEANSLVMVSGDRLIVDETSINPMFGAAIIGDGEILYAAVQAGGTVFSTRVGRNDVSPAGIGRKREILLRMRPGGSQADTVAASTYEAAGVWPRPGSTPLTVAVSASGAVAVADTSGAYKIHLTSASGERLLLCREAAPLPISDAELGRDVPEEWRASAAILEEVGPMQTPAAIGRLFFDAEDRLWVQRERNRPMGDGDRLLGVPGARHDVFSANGVYLGEVISPVAARLQSALNDTVWALESGEFEETWVVAYEMQDR